VACLPPTGYYTDRVVIFLLNTDQASTSQTISHPNPNPPASVHRPQPFLHPSPSGNIVIYNYEGWTPPANDGIARARARRRFFVALAWDFFIWIVLGSVGIRSLRIGILRLTSARLQLCRAILGGGAADISAGSRHRGSRHDGRVHTWSAIQSNGGADATVEEVLSAEKL
jgi:hypothetical protein